MSKKIRSDIGLTLTELVVASVLVGIVMTGIVAFNVSLKGIQDTSTLGANLSLEAATTMSLLRNDIVAAFGNSSDSGLIWTIPIGPLSANRSLCIRKDGGDLITGDPDGVGALTSDDVWTCYFYDGINTSTSYRALERCVRPAADPKITPISTKASCETGASSVQYLTNLSNSTFYATVGAPMQYVTITLRVFDPVRDPGALNPYPPATSPPFTASINPDNHTR
jgi:hypothetical protein